MISCLTGANFLKYGKRRMIGVANIILLIGVSMRMVDNLAVICVGTLFMGIGAGAFTVFCPKYSKSTHRYSNCFIVSELAPTELAGPLGTLNQFMLCFGIALPSIMCVPLPVNPTPAQA